MLDKNVFELLNRHLDGATSPREVEKVRAILEKNSEARKEFDDLKELKSLFQKAPVIDPPPSLSVRIRNAVSQSVPTSRPAPSRLAGVLSSWTARPRLRYAVSFAGGAVAGILLFVTFTGIPADTSSMAGTMGSERSVFRSVNVEAPGISGEISAQRVANQVHASIALEAPSGVEVIVEYSAGQLVFESLRTRQDDPAPVTLQPGTIHVGNTPHATYSILFRARSPEPTVLIASILENGTVVSKHSLDLEQKSH